MTIVLFGYTIISTAALFEYRYFRFPDSSADIGLRIPSTHKMTQQRECWLSRKNTVHIIFFISRKASIPAGQSSSLLALGNKSSSSSNNILTVKPAFLASAKLNPKPSKMVLGSAWRNTPRLQHGNSEPCGHQHRSHFITIHNIHKIVSDGSFQLVMRDAYGCNSAPSQYFPPLPRELDRVQEQARGKESNSSGSGCSCSNSVIAGPAAYGKIRLVEN